MINYDKLEKVGEYKNDSLHWYEGRDINAVYLIRLGDDFYIGSTQYVYTRIQAHISLLRKGQHTSYKMQEIFNFNSDFSIYVLKRGIDDISLLSCEMSYIKKYHPSLNVIIPSKKEGKLNILRIKDICEQKKISVTELGRMIGAAKSSIHTIINNGNPTVETLSKIAEALNVRITELFEEPTNINGYIELDGTIHKVSSKEDIKKLAEKL